MNYRTFALIILLGSGAGLFKISTAESTLDLEGTSIIGEQESPKVRFTIPWRQTKKTTLPKRPWVSQIKHEMAPLDRETFQQQLQLEQLTRPSELPR